MEMNKCGIYGLIDKENDYIYLGQSADISRRWSNHGSYLKKNEHRYKEIQNAYNKGVLGWTILEECLEEELADREDWWFKNAPKMGYIVVNKQKFGKKEHRVKDTSLMQKAQTGSNNPNCRYDEELIQNVIWMKDNGYSAKEIIEILLEHDIEMNKNYVYLIGKTKWKHLEGVKPEFIEEVAK